MGRKRIYHTPEEKAEAQRRNRMNWYDRYSPLQFSRLRRSLIVFQKSEADSKGVQEPKSR